MHNTLHIFNTTINSPLIPILQDIVFMSFSASLCEYISMVLASIKMFSAWSRMLIIKWAAIRHAANWNGRSAMLLF